jgi:hypothetical protein
VVNGKQNRGFRRVYQKERGDDGGTSDHWSNSNDRGGIPSCAASCIRKNEANMVAPAIIGAIQMIVVVK